MNLLTVEDVSQRLSISLSLAYDLVGKEIPCIRIRSAKRVRPEDLDAYLAENREQKNGKPRRAPRRPKLKYIKPS